MKGSISSNIVILIFFCFASVLRSDALGRALPRVTFPENSSSSAMMMVFVWFTSPFHHQTFKYFCNMQNISLYSYKNSLFHFTYEL